MRQQMAETASLLASAAYDQPQLQLQHYQAKLTQHLADPSHPLNLDIEGVNAERQGEGQEPSGERAEVQFSGLVETPPRTPGQDAAGRAARAKRVASSREVCSTTVHVCAHVPGTCRLCLQASPALPLNLKVLAKCCVTSLFASTMHVNSWSPVIAMALTGVFGTDCFGQVRHALCLSSSS